jgi:hypothetical protein
MKRNDIEFLKNVRLTNELRTFLASTILFLCTIGQAAAADPQFTELYDYYFPKNDKDKVASFYRQSFDKTLFGAPPKPGTERHPALYLAFHGDSAAFHKFVHSRDRDGAGEFSETWAAECLLLLLRLGDNRFAQLLSQEDKATREIVGGMIDAQVNWKKHSFPKTRALYSYRYVPPLRPPKRKPSDFRFE